ncbi:hypothetical protein [Pseudoalteromonas marina]|uniref:Uncharacterized protein n=1 Tax=Pseudoalteromonas marina TaxID=267375 RepID=A0ABT9FBZ2_9GAMM|nr:hypothetical protein [Pseudoalteromonas marina]MDP2564292.1 hypothetical protein [Pseudoalteromonas marina]
MQKNNWTDSVNKINEAIDNISNSDDLDLLIRETEAAVPEFEVINSKLEAAVKLGAKVFGAKSSLKTIQHSIRPILNSESITEELPEDVVMALQVIANYN